MRIVIENYCPRGIDERFRILSNHVIDYLQSRGWYKRLAEGKLVFRSTPPKKKIFKTDTDIVTVYHTPTDDREEIEFLQVVVFAIVRSGRICRLESVDILPTE